ncbi:ATP-binding cassette subfamily C protein CydCD [Leifsonia sp. AK011]|uniref:thiol reductant ABC exporter subunit CydC n=1 Tax=Leifsonia sp. AK011 TaxID=2723075 RepID=UPI0015CBC8B9|nr:thiol reductant ABC exporter subunit CydC [Leifsonia sp. AK011]NYF08952.1 ATP-binding cassette subfamily C protein CydCD [Leifsonia sp. AK011]
MTRKGPLAGINPRHALVLGLLAAVKAAALVGIAEAVASGIVSVIGGTDAWRGAVVLGLASGLVRAAITWASASYATRAAIGAKEQLRGELAERVLAGTDASVGSSSIVGTVGLDELDKYYRTALPATITAAVVPLLIGARILLADPVSAIIIVLTVPLVPVFMVLVGQHSKERADAASATLQRLSDQLAELARGLPVLVGLGRVEEQSAALREVSQRNRIAVMGTLRTAFLSSLVLELIATISVAVVAVFVGVRLVAGDLPLEVGLLALVLAPECFTPFRELGAAFHSSQDGLAAMRKARDVIDAPVAPDAREAGDSLTVRDLVVVRDDRNAPIVDGLSFTAPHGSITAIEGASGAGKSTVLGVLAGLVPVQSGSVRGVVADRVAWVPQHPRTIAATVWHEVRLYADTDAATDDALEALGLTAIAADDPTRVSPGELRRIGVARGLVRVAAGATVLLLDEPTAHLDPASADLVERAIEGLRGQVTIVLASHEASVGELADHRVLLATQGGLRDADEAAAPSAPLAARDGAATVASKGAVAELLAFVGAAPWRTLGAVLLGSAAALAALSLTAVSGWLIVRASEQPPIMYLLVAIVGVRFFGIARAGLRYAERLATHDSVLEAETELRARLWSGLAARGLSSRALASGGTALDYLVGAADRVRDLVPRVILPPAVAVVTAGAALIAVAMLHPAAVPVLAAGAGASVVLGPLVALLADRRAAVGTGAVRSTVLREFTAMVAASGDLSANGVGPRVVQRLATLDARAGRLARSTAWALGLGHAVVILAGVAAAVLMLPATVDAVAAGILPPAIVAVLVLIPLGLIEPLLGLVDSVQQWPALAAALRRVREVATPVPASPGTITVDRIDSLELDSLEATWPGAGAPAFGHVSVEAHRGDWIVVEGPSGSGKSTLLTTLLGYLPATSGRVLINGMDARALDETELRHRIAWCPQEAHLFDSTIRGNLLLARGRDDRPTDLELELALIKVGLGPLLSSRTDGLDTRVGSAGERLSGGERQRLAVARTLLSDADVVLLDEPTAHLDAAAAESLMNDLRFALRGRIVVLVTHHGSERRDGDLLVRLGSASTTSAASATLQFTAQ